MTGPLRDYGQLGRVAIAVPQANPTVEAELSILLPRQVSLHVTRLRSDEASAADRLVHYLEHLHLAVATFDSFRPDCLGFACTGSSYLVGMAREAELVAAESARSGIAIDTATGAIRWALDTIGARRLAIVTPYPAFLSSAAQRFWSDAGYTVVRDVHVDIGGADTRGIYNLRAVDARPVLSGLKFDDVDAVLLSGTGLPSLPLLADWQDAPPLLSSNLCLAAKLLDRLGLVADAPFPFPAGWRERLTEAVPA
jgi:maleate isomerase